jgi:RimJ/RimL family protein N-acetyltransferase
LQSLFSAFLKSGISFDKTPFPCLALALTWLYDKNGDRAVKTPFIETERLILRQWHETDQVPYAKLNGNPEVMAYFPRPLSRAESDARIRYFRSLIIRQRWGVWALERKSDGAFIGSAGIMKPVAHHPFYPCIEIGWRLDLPFWGFGYATEAANASLHFGFTQIELPEIIAFTAVTNAASRAVMHRIGMTDLEQDFDHPHVPVDSPHRRYCVYAITQEVWEERHPHTG